MHLFLSPHLDDAALSCGGTIYHLVQQGQRVMVVNVMAGDPPNPLPDSPLIRELHERWKTGENPVKERREEDHTALGILGAEVTFMNIRDCVYRIANEVVLYPYGDDDIFGEIAIDDPARHELSSQQYLPVELTQVTHIYAPLAVGHHVDHQLVRDWGWQLKQENTLAELYFYEDYPYGEDANAVQKAVNLCPVPITPQIKTLSEADFEAKVKAIAAYRSQISTFWNGFEQMRTRVRQHMWDTPHEQLVEHYWRAR